VSSTGTSKADRGTKEDEEGLIGWREGVVMPDDDEFTDLVARARAGDAKAIRDFLSRFEREVRMMVRARLPKRLSTRFDSLDFVQAVWQSFFVDRPLDSPEFDKVEHLRGYLAGVVRNKVFEQHRRLTRTGKYDLSREERLYVRCGDRDVPRDVAAPDPSPSQAAQASDRMAQLTAGRSPRSVDVISLRREGLTFDEIAAQTGVNERTVRRIIKSARSRMEAHRCQR
jgi:RNA polymerase sigma-70 factor (ECF subfamily)